ncbi:hypothetical protein N0O92_20505 [Alkalihalobacillus sp. MEB130]|uniref:hypothetical protein n=1 Tax=Alkalihalobacillus sp. MEB130 TaxID=2976704 RepID=UPI0028DD9342|nr:hypothetical protein [Alkalihalobacillus sp. MEB130]MDT8862585.1 hypothetical protein [Alkalihalobacillus sp. MEB130]
MFSNEQLQALIEGKIIGNQYPYDTNNEQQIEAHIRQLFYRINRSPNIVCEAEWDHFGSGYASFVEFFCYRKEDVTVEEEKYGIQEIKTNGIIIDICRLAPVVIMGEDEREKTIRIKTNEVVRGAYGTILDGKQFDIKEPLQKVGKQVKHTLKEFGYELLEAEKLTQPLPFQSKIPTIYRKPNEYLWMDAIFYWED